MNRGTMLISLAAVLLAAAVLAGEFLAYNPVTERDAEAQWSDGSVSYSVRSTGSDAWDSVLLEKSGPYTAPTRALIYIDPDYEGNYSEACALSDADPFHNDPSDTARQIELNLNMRGFRDISRIGDGELTEMTSGSGAGTALIVLSYALPSSVYTGSGSDALIAWISSGGAVYWLGSEAGLLYKTADGLARASENTLLGTGTGVCHEDTQSGDAVSGGLTGALKLSCTSVLFGTDSGLQAGYCLGAYASMSFIGKGSGYICAVAGDADYYSIGDLTQALAAGITPGTAVLAHDGGTAVRETLDRSFGFSGTAAGKSLYIYFGGTYACKGAVFRG